MKKLLVICGPTATGKTKVAFNLAEKFNGELVSADSRQVYKKMDIGTGKDLPKSFKFSNSDLGFKNFNVGYYTNGEIRIWGYDLVEPNEEFSVSEYSHIVKNIMIDVWKRGKLPILVGGTGLYIKGVVDGIETSIIPKNVILRKSLETKFASELFEILTRMDPVKAASLNVSDKKNPRRLVRAIEISKSKIKYDTSKSKKQDILFIALKTDKQKLARLIEKRVNERIKRGFEDELKSLLDTGIIWGMQAMSSLGYYQYKDYAFGRISKKKAIDNWKKEEKKFAKRQMTWFKRDKRIRWFDINKRDCQKRIEKLVNKWYSSSNGSSTKN